MTHQQTSENPSRILTSAFEGLPASTSETARGQAIRRGPNTPGIDYAALPVIGLAGDPCQPRGRASWDLRGACATAAATAAKVPGRRRQEEEPRFSSDESICSGWFSEWIVGAAGDGKRYRSAVRVAAFGDDEQVMTPAASSML